MERREKRTMSSSLINFMPMKRCDEKGGFCMKMSRAKKAKDFATLIGVGTCLLVTLSACENSKHAEIMSTEDLRAQAQMSADTDAETGTESAQGGIPFDGESVSQEPLSLSDTFAFAPEPPPSPASPRSAEVAALLLRHRSFRKGIRNPHGCIVALRRTMSPTHLLKFFVLPVSGSLV